MSLFKEEFLKIASNQTLLFAIVISFLLNGFFGIYLYSGNHANQNQCTPAGYRMLHQKISGLSEREAKEYIEKKRHQLMDIRQNQSLSMHTDDSEYDVEYEDDFLSEYNLFENVWSEIEHCDHYAEEISEIINRAKEILQSRTSVFTTPFGNSNQKKVIADYSKYANVQKLPYGPSKGIEALTDSVVTDLLCIMVTLLLVIILVTNERNTGEIIFYQSTYRGSLELATAKYLVLVFFSFLIWGAFTLFDILLASKLYGFGNLARPLQSVLLFQESVCRLSVGQFLGAYLACKLLGALLFASLFYTASILFRRNFFLYLTVLGCMAVSIVLYQNIDANSAGYLLKYINLYAFLNTKEIFFYRNLNILDIPVSYISVSLFVQISMILISTWLSLLIFTNGLRAKRTEGSSIKKYSFGGSRFVSLWMGEAYKLFINGRGLFLLCVYLLFLFVSAKPVWEEYYIPKDSYYEAYIEKLKGPVTTEKVTYIETEQKRFEQLIDDYEQGKTSEDEYQHKMQGYEAFERIYLEKLPYLQEHGGYFIHDIGYRILTGDGIFAHKDIQMAFCASLLLIYIFSYLYGIEYQNGTNVILQTTYRGGAPSLFVKAGLGMAAITITYIATYLPLYISVFQRYGLDGGKAPANSLENLSELPAAVTLSSYLTGVAIIRYLGYIFMMTVFFYLAHCTKNVMVSCIVGLFLVELPLALAFLDIHFAKYLLFNPLILGNF